MKNKNLKQLLSYDLQMFAEEGSAKEGSAEGAEGNNDGDGKADPDAGQGQGEKTFTQSEVSGMMAKEKNEGRRSILKSLGFKSEDDAKKAIEEYNKYLESQKTESEKQQEALKKANGEREDALRRAQIAENKVACYNAGINADYVDDVLAIASTKITDDKDLDAVLKEMKGDKKYESFFGKEGSSSHGTGSNAGHSGSGSEGTETDYAKKLAEKYRPSANQKSSFFND